MSSRPLVVRRRRGFAGVVPHRVPGAWSRWNWLWWTWDRPAEAEAAELAAVLDWTHRCEAGPATTGRDPGA